MTRPAAFLAFAALIASPVAAQTGSSLGGIGGLLGGGGIPNVASASAGNAAGLLGYCLKNNLLSGGGAGKVLGNLTGRQGLTTSPDFLAGQQGTLKTGNNALSLDGLKGQVKTQVCNLVLNRAKGVAGL